MSLLDLNLGPILVGTALSIFFGGILVTQCYTYYLRFPGDPIWMRLMVLYFFISDLVHSGVECAITYSYTITEFGNLPAITGATNLFACIPLLSVSISSVAQGFFAWRVARLTRIRSLGYLIGFLAIVQFLCAIGVTIGVVIVRQFTSFIQFQGVVIPWLASSALCDLIITGSLVWYLSANKSGIPATDDLVSRLIRLTVQTGAITLVWAVLDLVIYLTEDNSLHLIFNFPLAKVYTNSLLSTLNARRAHQDTLHVSAGDTMGASRGAHKLGLSTATSTMPTWDKPTASSGPYVHTQITHDIEIPKQHRIKSNNVKGTDMGDLGQHEADYELEEVKHVEEDSDYEEKRVREEKSGLHMV